MAAGIKSSAECRSKEAILLTVWGETAGSRLLLQLREGQCSAAEDKDRCLFDDTCGPGPDAQSYRSLGLTSVVKTKPGKRKH